MEGLNNSEIVNDSQPEANNTEIVKVDPINLELQKFDTVKELMTEIANKCKNIIVNSVETLATAETLATQAKKIENKIETFRVSITAPYLVMQRKIKAKADDLTKELSNELAGLRNQILTFKKEQERIRQKELKELQEEKRKAEEEQRAKIKEDTQTTFSVPVPTFVSPEIQAREKALEAVKPKGLRKVWKAEIIDEALIPREYLLVDTSKINAVVKAGIREIPGVRIYEDDALYLR